MLFGNVQCEAYIPRQENTDNWKCKRLMGFLKITPPGRSKDSKAGLFSDNRKNRLDVDKCSGAEGQTEDVPNNHESYP